MAGKKDFTQTALDVVKRATGETVAPTPPSKKQESGRKALKAAKPKARSLRR